MRFVLAWSAPTWNGIGYNWATEVPKRYKGSPRTFTHMYVELLSEYRRDRPGSYSSQEPRLTAASRPRLAAGRLHRRLAAGLAPRVVGQHPAHDHRRQPLGAGQTAGSIVGDGKGRAVCDARMPAGVPERRVHPLLALRQHSAGLFLPAKRPFRRCGDTRATRKRAGRCRSCSAAAASMRRTAIRPWPAGATRSR